jgi:hypothetical protein
MSGGQLGTEFPRRVNRWIDGAEQSSLRLSDCTCKLAEGDVPNHHEVEVARSVLFAPGNRAVDECSVDLPSQRGEEVPKRCSASGSLDDDLPQLVEYRAVAIALKVDVSASGLTPQDPRTRQLRDFALNLPDPQASALGDLAQVECLVRVAVEQSKNCSSSFREQR